MDYVISLIPLVFIYCVLTLGLNLQYGLTGILNFTYFTFVAVGAYFGAVLSMGPAQPDMGLVYVLGTRLPFPLMVIGGGLAATGVGYLVSFAALRRLRSDYLAIVTVGAGYIIYTIVGNVTPLFNGWNGLFNIPTPVPASASPNGQMLIFSAICLVTLVLTWFCTRRIRHSAMGRMLRAIRDDDGVAEAFGRNVYRTRLLIFALGSFVAGIGGALLAEYATAFNPQAFLPPETFILWAALIIGGVGNNWGAMLGALIVPVAFAEITRFLPEIGRVGLVDSLRGVIIGILLILVLRFMPNGLLPERTPVDRGDGPAAPTPLGVPAESGAEPAAAVGARERVAPQSGAS